MIIRNVTNGEHCDTCENSGRYVEVRRIRGSGAIHNERVRNYRGGRRPNMSTDYNEYVTYSCSCEAGEQFARTRTD